MEKPSETHLDDQKYQNPTLRDVPANVTSSPTEKAMEDIRKKIDRVKDAILKKYSFVQAIGIIPPQAAQLFDEENELTNEEKKKKPLHLVVILENGKEKEFSTVKNEILKMIKDSGQAIWLNIFLERDVWEIAMDSKYAVVEAIGMCFPLFDKGVLGALRVAEIHKSLVLKKFEKYVYSYVVGGSLPRGEVVATSDVDTYVIIDDTDVKRMPRLELKEKLRNIIYSYVMDAGQLSGVKNKLSVQVYLLTEFWEGVKDANPIFYTFLRDGIPLYDRGGFLPWKLLLKMGKIKPTPESIDMFMSMGDKTQEMAKRRLLDIVIGDIYYGMLTPSQGLLMLYGLPPTNVRETVTEMKRVFVDKEKLLEKKYWEMLEEIAIKYFKGYEHGKIKEVSGKDVDRLLKNSEDYLKRLQELRGALDTRMGEKTFTELYDQVFKIMKALFGNKSEASLIKTYEEEIVRKGTGNPKFLHSLNILVQTKKAYAKKKVPSKYDVESLRRDSVYLIESLVEYGQRRELGLLQHTKVIVTHKGKQADLFLVHPVFFVEGEKIRKIGKSGFVEADINELNEALASYHGRSVKLDARVMKILKKELGEFDVHL